MTWKEYWPEMRRKYIREQAVEDVQLLSGDLTPEVYARLSASREVAWDIETDGLDPLAASIGTCQLHARGIGTYIVARVSEGSPQLLARLLSDEDVRKVFHHAPFDLSFMSAAWSVSPNNVACTKIAAKILRPTAPSEEYSLKYLMSQHFGVKLEKHMRFSDWMADALSDAQVQYAARDVLKLLDLHDLLVEMLKADGVYEIYEKCCAFLPVHAQLKVRGCPDPFSY
ncbi:ribonuclease D [Actinomadura decatromicini]|uniref:Ribonuclease D n=1 Tax=Actinomadura decatromicini TaxID=2604572 RepID=A0A5D3FSM1_9ACTN|nr:ribonuclease D [Actinomadura decatromicini]TYK50740.1 ribonuclease D [Actinomadura decatromicini]